MLKDEKFNDSWHRSFSNQSRAQNVNEILDPNYCSISNEEKDLSWKNRITYMLFLNPRLLLIEANPLSGNLRIVMMLKLSIKSFVNIT
jgi:hypothetical protein